MISYTCMYFFQGVQTHHVNYFTFHNFSGGKQRQVLLPHFTDEVPYY